MMAFGSVVLAAVINAWILLSLAPVTGALIYLRRYYIKSSRELRRIEGLGMNNKIILKKRLQIRALVNVNRFELQQIVRY
jgi:hypothetical protein